MKYLKKFNESSEIDLKEFCEMYLAYLIDDDFVINVSINGYNVHDIIIKKDNNVLFQWESINSYIIPFIHILKNTYGTINNSNGKFITFHCKPKDNFTNKFKNILMTTLSMARVQDFASRPIYKSYTLSEVLENKIDIKEYDIIKFWFYIKI